MARPRNPYAAPTQTLGTPNSPQRRAGQNVVVMKPRSTGSGVTPSQYAPQAPLGTQYSTRTGRGPSSYGEFHAAPQTHASQGVPIAPDSPAFPSHDIQPQPQQSIPDMGAARPAPSRLPLNNFTPARVTGAYGDTSQMGPAGNGIYGQQPIPVSRNGQFSAPSFQPTQNNAPPAQNYGLPDDLAASLRQQAAAPRHPAEMQPVYQLPNGTTSNSPPITASAVPARPALGSYGGVNGYNTPNMNTYVAPGGRVASGLGDNTPSINGQIAAHQHQQMLNGLSASDANQLRLGGAKPEQPFSMAAPPTLDSNSRFATPRGVNFNPTTGSTYFRNGNGSGIIGANAAAALQSQGIRQADLAGTNYNPEVRDALHNIAQASESRLAAERTAAGGGLSLSGKYRQSQRDVLARRGMVRNPTAPLGANAQDLVNRQNSASNARSTAQSNTRVQQDLYNQALKTHLATMTPQQQMSFLQQQLSPGGSGRGIPQAAPAQRPTQRGWLTPAARAKQTAGQALEPLDLFPDMSPPAPRGHIQPRF